MSKKRSDIWLHLENSTDKDKAKCNYCHQILTVKCGTMGNLHRHMKNKHPTIPVERQQDAVTAGKFICIIKSIVRLLYTLPLNAHTLIFIHVTLQNVFYYLQYKNKKFEMK